MLCFDYLFWVNITTCSLSGNKENKATGMYRTKQQQKQIIFLHFYRNTHILYELDQSNENKEKRRKRNNDIRTSDLSIA